MNYQTNKKISMCNIASEFTKILKSDELACAIVSVYWCT